MAVMKALRQVPGALGRNPVIFVVLGAFGLLQAPQLLAQTVNPLLASVVSLGLSAVLVFLVPFVQAGLIEMADEALDGQTDLGTFLQAGREYYLSVLVAYLAIVAMSFALGVVGFVGSLFGGVAAMVGGPGIVVLVVVGLVLAAVALVYLVVVFFVQFYGQEIVLDGVGAVDGLKASAGLVRRNLAPAAGYTVVVMAVSGAMGAAAALVSFLLRPDSPTTVSATEAPATVEAATLSPAAAVGLAVVYAVGSALVGGFLLTFSVAFYRELRGATPD
jgi:hypothetical protein